MRGIDDSERDSVASCKVTGGVLILGDIPNPHNQLPVHSIIQHNKGLISKPVIFMPPPVWLKIIQDEDNFNSIVWDEFEWFTADEFTDFGSCDINRYIRTRCQLVPCNGYAGSRPHYSYLKARQARFEHGETP